MVNQENVRLALARQVHGRFELRHDFGVGIPVLNVRPPEKRVDYHESRAQVADSLAKHVEPRNRVRLVAIEHDMDAVPWRRQRGVVLRDREGAFFERKVQHVALLRLASKPFETARHARREASDERPAPEPARFTIHTRRTVRLNESRDTLGTARVTRHRQVKYLNNVVAADHGKLKQLIRPVRGFKTLKTAYATIKGFEVMRALRKGQARVFALQDGIVGEARIVERAFGVGPCALSEAIVWLQDHLASAET